MPRQGRFAAAHRSFDLAVFHDSGLFPASGRFHVEPPAHGGYTGGGTLNREQATGRRRRPGNLLAMPAGRSSLDSPSVAGGAEKRSPMASPVRKKVFIVDDHPIVRLGLSQVIGREADLEVCGEAADMANAMRQIEATGPDLVVIDIALDGESGIELMEYVHERWPAVKMLVSSAHDERLFAGRVLRAGAMGYISKRDAIPKIVDALRHVLRGEVYLSPEMASSLLAARRPAGPWTRTP